MAIRLAETGLLFSADMLLFKLYDGLKNGRDSRMENAQSNFRRDDLMADKGKIKGVSGSTVKITAVAAMVIDHVAAVVLLRVLLADGYVNMAQEGVLYYVYQIMRSIGRVGFPVFCFLLVEGFQKTRDVRKYALRLIVYALISEIPFDLAVCGQFSLLAQNVYFTLFLGLFVLCTFRFFEKTVLPRAAGILFVVTGALTPTIYCGMLTRFTFLGTLEERAARLGVVFIITVVFLAFYGGTKGVLRLQRLCGSITILMFVMYLADFMMTDYGGMGVLTIAVMYMCRRRKSLAMAAGCVVLTAMSLGEVPAFLGIIPIALYNGKRGLKLKNFFYAFYPAHLLILYLIAVWMGYGGVSLL